MRSTGDKRAYRALGHRKSRDRALVLPLVGLILLLPPIAGIFRLDASIGGVPVTLLYLFSVWALLIGAAAALSGRLRDGAERPVEPGAQETDGQRHPAA